MPEIIELKSGNQRLTINQTGAGIMEYYLDISKGRQDIIYGYSASEENSAFMGCVLFPFPGRVENSQYQFEGKEYQLSGVKIKDGQAIHGFVRGVDWQVEKKTGSEAVLSYEMTKAEYQAKGYPFSVEITINYSLGNNGLTCRTKVENIGREAAPFGLGFHPYFTVGTDNINDMIIRIKAKQLVEFSFDLQPTGKLIDIDGNDLNFNQPGKIGSRIIDNCYTDLAFMSHLVGGTGGIAETVLSDGGDCEITIWQDENFPYLQVYSADTIGDKHRRKGFAVEPQTCTGFAFNLPKMGLKVLQPGEVFMASWGVK